ncbi:MAG: sodium:calcium antiporter, partial [Oscillospiraceae bacterium]
MELFLIAVLFTVGLVLIVKGGDWFVDSASWLAEVTGIPKFIIGATIVSVATTLPEMIVSIMAALDGKVDMAVGNAVGSVVANTGLILALSLICIPGVINRKQFTS